MTTKIFTLLSLISTLLGGCTDSVTCWCDCPGQRRTLPFSSTSVEPPSCETMCCEGNDELLVQHELFVDLRGGADNRVELWSSNNSSGLHHGFGGLRVVSFTQE